MDQPGPKDGGTYVYIYIYIYNIYIYICVWIYDDLCSMAISCTYHINKACSGGLCKGICLQIWLHLVQCLHFRVRKFPYAELTDL